MFAQYVWHALRRREKEFFLTLINALQDTRQASPDSATVRWALLPFYQTMALVRVEDTAWPAHTGPCWFLAQPGCLFEFLEQPGCLFMLDGASTAIHEANEADPIMVTEHNALDYLRFFCYFVHGDEGPFFIVEDLDHPALEASQLDEATSRLLQETMRPAALDGTTADGHLAASALVLYGSSLFCAHFALSCTGMIEMLDDEPIAANLPITGVWQLP